MVFRTRVRRESRSGGARGCERCSCEMRECGSEKCAGRWVVSIQRCLWLCRGKVAVRRTLLSSRGARRVEDLGSSASPAGLSIDQTDRPRDPSSTSRL